MIWKGMWDHSGGSEDYKQKDTLNKWNDESKKIQIIARGIITSVWKREGPAGPGSDHVGWAGDQVFQKSIRKV